MDALRLFPYSLLTILSSLSPSIGQSVCQTKTLPCNNPKSETVPFPEICAPGTDVAKCACGPIVRCFGAKGSNRKYSKLEISTSFSQQCSCCQKRQVAARQQRPSPHLYTYWICICFNKEAAKGHRSKLNNFPFASFYQRQSLPPCPPPSSGKDFLFVRRQSEVRSNSTIKITLPG
ncbi:uncharacterized protein J3D65DRAFT_343068 [Phyllosticta citribraziliensis]|uniref:Uncharacterized protein n=1 Tax=Phyllosticta citribraziliensis TaxID=989973 RepID=A0ABR1LU62_9PEZI